MSPTKAGALQFVRNHHKHIRTDEDATKTQSHILKLIMDGIDGIIDGEVATWTQQVFGPEGVIAESLDRLPTM